MHCTGKNTYLNSMPYYQYYHSCLDNEAHMISLKSASISISAPMSTSDKYADYDYNNTRSMLRVKSPVIE